MDKKYLATLLGVSESDVSSVSGFSFELANAPSETATFKDILTARVKKKVESLTVALLNEDDLGKVVRGHIHIEHELLDLISLAAPDPTHLKKLIDRIEFCDKVQFALVLGLKSELASPLRALGTLRNKFSHRLDTKMEEVDVENLIANFSSVARQRCQALLRDALSGLPKTSALKGEARSYFDTNMQLLVFFLHLFREVAEERDRLAFEKMQTMAWQ